MKVQTTHLKPGMVLLKEVLGTSNKPLIKSKTKLTESHLLFLRKFMVPAVTIVPLPGSSYNEQVFQDIVQETDFEEKYERIVEHYQSVVMATQNHVPLNNLFDIRKRFIPFFEAVQEQPFINVLQLFAHRKRADELGYKSVAMSMLAIYIAKGLGFEKKDWLQIGFAALLADIGFARMSKEVRNEKHSGTPSEAFRMHPFHSYKIIEAITTLSNRAKVAILQHHERLNGSGYPANLSGDKITPYARIIAVCDCLYQMDHQPLSKTISLLQNEKGVKLDQRVIGYLINQLKSTEK